MRMFTFKIDAEITHFFFFKGKNVKKEDMDLTEMDEDDRVNIHHNLLKKNYLYLTTDGNITIKNLGISKKSISSLSRKIFWEYVVPRIKSEKRVKFPKSFYMKIIKELLEKDISLAEMRFNVNDADAYKLDSQIQCQISKKYGGAGIYFLIPNTLNIGAGIGKSYCTLEEFKERNMKIEHIDLSNVWKELEYFIQPVKTKNLFDF